MTRARRQQASIETTFYYHGITRKLLIAEHPYISSSFLVWRRRRLVSLNEADCWMSFRLPKVSDKNDSCIIPYTVLLYWGVSVVMPVVKRKAQECICEDGKTPFKNWLVALKDARGRAKITKAVTQMEAGNFGDHKPIAGGNGLQERRIDYGPGYRIYYITEGGQLIVLFVGSDKSDQQTMIDTAKRYLADYKARKPRTAPETHTAAEPPARQKRKSKR